MVKNPNWSEHCINLDVLRWPGKSEGEQADLRKAIHDKLEIQKICHIWRLSVYCYCQVKNEEKSRQPNLRLKTALGFT